MYTVFSEHKIKRLEMNNRNTIEIHGFENLQIIMCLENYSGKFEIFRIKQK